MQMWPLLSSSMFSGFKSLSTQATLRTGSRKTGFSPVDNIVLVQVLNGKDELGGVQLHHLFRKAAFAFQVKKELAWQCV